MTHLGSKYKDTMASFATGVCVVTSDLDGTHVGITINSLVSICLSPPIISVSILSRSPVASAIEKSGFFVVNILRSEMQEYGIRFANPALSMIERFKDLEGSYNTHNCFILGDSLGHLECKLDHQHKVQDHILFFGEVTNCHTNPSYSPLIYHNRAWKTLR